MEQQGKDLARSSSSSSSCVSSNSGNNRAPGSVFQVMSHDDVAAIITKEYGGEPASLEATLARTFGATRGVCNKQWGLDEIAYRCLDCQKLEVTAFCADCFRAGGHEDHRYVMYISTSGGTCDCGMPGTMDLRFCCPKHGVGMPDTSALQRDIDAGRLDELCRCFRHHLEAALEERKSSIQFLHELADMHWALRFIIWHTISRMQQEDRDWVLQALRSIIRRRLLANVTTLLVSLIPVPAMKQHLAARLLDVYEQLSNVHCVGSEPKRLISEHVRLTVQIFSSPGHTLDFLLKENLVKRLLDNFSRFLSGALTRRPNVEAEEASHHPPRLASGHRIFVQFRFWALVCDLKDYVAYDQRVPRDFLENPASMAAYANICRYAELADVNVREIRRFVDFEADHRETIHFNAFYDATLFMLTCQSYFFLWSSNVQEELKSDTSSLRASLVRSLCTCYAALREVLCIPFSFPHDDVYSPSLPLHRQISVLLGALRRHLSCQEFTAVLEQMGAATERFDAQSPAEVARSLSLWPLRLLSARARHRVGMWKRNGTKPYHQMYLYTNVQTPNVLLADVFLVQLLGEVVPASEYVGTVARAFLHSTPWVDVAEGRKDVNAALDGVDELDRLSYASLLTDLQRFLLLTLQDTPLVTGDFQGLIDNHAQGTLALGKQVMSRVDSHTLNDPSIAKHASLRESMNRMAVFHRATVSHGTMRQGFFEMKPDKWAEINWPLVAALTVDLRNMNTMLDNYNKAMKLPGNEVAEYQRVRTSSILRIPSIIASPELLQLQQRLLSAMLTMLHKPSYSPSVTGTALSLIAAAVERRAPTACDTSEEDELSPSELSEEEVDLLAQSMQQMRDNVQNTKPLDAFIASVRKEPRLVPVVAGDDDDDDDDTGSGLGSSRKEEAGQQQQQQRRKKAKKRRNKLVDKMLQQSASFMKHLDIDSSEDESEGHHHPQHTIVQPPVPRTRCVVCQRSITTHRTASLFGIYTTPASQQLLQKRTRDLLVETADAKAAPETLVVASSHPPDACRIMQLCQHYVHNECKQGLTRCPICQTETHVSLTASVLPDVIAAHHSLSYDVASPPIVGVVQRYRHFGARNLAPPAVDAAAKGARPGRHGFSSNLVWWISGEALESAADDPLEQAWLLLQEEAAFLHYLTHTVETTTDAFQPSFTFKYFLYKVVHIGMELPQTAEDFMVKLHERLFKWLQGNNVKYRTPLELDSEEFSLLLLFGAALHCPFQPQDFKALCKLVLSHAVARQLLVCGIDAQPLKLRGGVEEGTVFQLNIDGDLSPQTNDGIVMQVQSVVEQDPRVTDRKLMYTPFLHFQLAPNSSHEPGPFVVVLDMGERMRVHTCFIGRGETDNPDPRVSAAVPLESTDKPVDDKIKITVWPVQYASDVSGFFPADGEDGVGKQDVSNATQALLLGQLLATPGPPTRHRTAEPCVNEAGASRVLDALQGNCTRAALVACKQALDGAAVHNAMQHALRLLVALKCALFEERMEVPKAVRCDDDAVVDTYIHFLDLADTYPTTDWSSVESLCETVFGREDPLVHAWLYAFNLRCHISYPYQNATGSAQGLPSRILPDVPRLIPFPATFERFFRTFCEGKPEALQKDKLICLMCGQLVSSLDSTGTRNFPHSGRCCPLYMKTMQTYVVYGRGRRYHAWGTCYLDEFDEEDLSLARGRKLLLNRQRLNLLHEDWLRHRVEKPSTRH